MIVSWNWLKEYLPLDMSPAEATERLMMSGLNHESTDEVGSDLAIDLEVTSNRPDCLGHLGIAREIAVLFDKPLKIPAAQPKAVGGNVQNFARVRIDAPDLCPRYTARLVSGVKVGPSPSWLVDRLKTVGQASVNNVVDITNYVLMECGQPLHAFDFRRLAGREIIVRRAREGETIEAIDHVVYKLEPEMCVIADSEAPVAIAGVMGGASTEISPKTTELLIEAAEFAPLSVRSTSRKLKLRSDSSYRFERGVDPAGVDWASRRCAELVLELCGGELCEGVIDIGRGVPEREPITLRFSQLQRILGIEVPAETAVKILRALGLELPKGSAGAADRGEAAAPKAAERESVTLVPPSWRRDLTREIDLIEEVARVYGYDKIPEDVAVPMAPSHRTDAERVIDKVRHVLTAAGFDEAMTTSVVPQTWADAFRAWTSEESLATFLPMLKGADRLRNSLVPSLLGARAHNESAQNEEIELFETAHLYLPQPGGLPSEPWALALTSGRDYYFVKGVLEQLLAVLGIASPLVAEAYQGPLLDEEKASRLTLDGEALGFLGEVSPAGRKQFNLRGATTVAEIDLGVLVKRAVLIPQHRSLSKFPPMTRDLNLIVDEAVHWADLAATVREAAGPLLESLRYQETYRDPAKDGPGKKRLLFTLTLRSSERTLTGEEADATRDAVVGACRAQHQATLLA